MRSPSLRRAARLAIVLVAAALPFVACSFPDVSFGPAAAPETGTNDGPTTSDAMADGDVVSVGANEDVDPTGAMMDATVITDPGQLEAGPDGCCDCDNDHFRADGGTCSFPSQDCDDLNPNIFPGQGFVAGAMWTSPHQPEGDWNCDGVRTKQYDYNQKCNDTNNCNGKSGFNDDPNCEETAVFNNCSYNPGIAGLLLASCKVGTTVMTKQHCK
ncbi:MAG: hypothetical protein QOI41_3811 [Myxococcales bacterium]|nr:hypothetical protein [Myxococcales bacterium]